MGRAVGWFFRFCYIFYLVLGITGVIGYVLGIDKLLYITTAVSLLVYILQMVTGTVVFSSGKFFLPLGAVLGFLFFGGIRGACLGIHIVFLARHFLRDIVYGLIFRLVRMGSDTKQT